MRWNELTALTAVGALFGGAYLLGYHPSVLGFDVHRVDSTLHGTYYIESNKAYARNLMAVIAAAALIFGAVRVLGSPRVRALASTALCLGSSGVAMTVWPQYLLPRQGMPRRYIDYPEAFETWNRIANTGSLVALGAGAILLSCLALALWRRFISVHA